MCGEKDIRDKYLWVCCTKPMHLLRFLYSLDDKQDWEKCLLRGEIRVFGKIVGVKYQLKKYDELQWSAPLVEPSVRCDYSVVYSDSFMVVVDKPAPLPVHPCGSYLKNTLTFLLKSAGYRLFSVNRIDKETSGLVLFAREPHYVEILAKALAEGTKLYSVLVHGQSKERFYCDFPLAKKKDSLVHKRMGRYFQGESAGAKNKGKPSKTFFQRVFYWDKANLSLLIARPLTGRTHQIRTHLVEMGYSVVGDKIYGKNEENFLLYLAEGNSERVIKNCDGLARQFLHAGFMSFFHPWLDKKMSFSSELPAELKDYLKRVK